MSEETIRVTADDSAAQAVIARAEAQVENLRTKTATVTLGVTQSASAAAAALTALTNVGLATFDLLGIAIDETLKATLQLALGYGQQLALIASSTSVINPAYAVLIATAATTLQARAIQLHAAGQAEARASLEKSTRLMNSVTQSLVILTRGG